MQCCAESIKCCTDKLVGVVNCVGFPSSIALIVCKSYDVTFTDNINWGYTILPTASLFVINLTYFMCWRTLKKTIKNKPLFNTDSYMESP